jgi:hypothetical protein
MPTCLFPSAAVILSGACTECTPVLSYIVHVVVFEFICMNLSRQTVINISTFPRLLFVVLARLVVWIVMETLPKRHSISL